MIQKPKGTRDILPAESFKWQIIEEKIKKVLDTYNYKEIRVPVFEHTELFLRGVGETTDVVQKEMYTFDDKGGRSITLRPEGTAGAIRAYIENGMGSEPSPQRLWYNMGMYRYENVQKGRLREFHQIGIEIIGSKSYLADCEVIFLAKAFFDALNIPNIKLNINSIGCPKCRAEYQKKLREFIGKNLDSYCDTCKTRFEKNPMRILDCKEEKCKRLNVGVPMMIDYLCEECKDHFEKVKSTLERGGINYEIDASIVRGLDYYTKTVFEFIDEKTGLTVLGGGRYDGLVEELGGVPTPAVGFGMGMERVLEMFEENNQGVQDKTPKLYILSASSSSDSNDNSNSNSSEIDKAQEIALYLRSRGICVETDIMERSFKAQMKYADRVKTQNLMVIGETELSTGIAKIRNMVTGEEKEVALKNEDIYSALE